MNPKKAKERELKRIQRAQRDGQRRMERLLAIKDDNRDLRRRLQRMPPMHELKRIGRRADRNIREVTKLHGSDPLGVSGSRPGLARSRNLLVIAVVLALFVEIAGLPHLRVSYEYRGRASDPTIISAQYLSITGMRRVGFTEMPSGSMPLVALLPLERSLIDYGRNVSATVWSYARDHLSTSKNTPQ